jgi:predicted esterase YcpF (UPF0227 family)
MRAPGEPLTHLLYLHGFRSSPGSFKARRMADWLASHRPDLHWWCPQLPAAPMQALQLLIDGVEGTWPLASTAVIGSSLGGFYATMLAERWDCRAALLNPAVDPARDLAGQVGTHPGWHDPLQTIEFRAADLDALRSMAPGALTRPERYFALLAQGDAVLDWRDMAARYAGAQLHVIEGSDHALSDFDRHLPGLLAFLGLDG